MRHRPPHLNADLDRVGPQFDPVVDQEADGCEGPHRREQSQIPKLHAHLTKVSLHVVEAEFGLVAHTRQERSLGGLIGEAVVGDDPVPGILELFGFAEDFALQEGDKSFERETNGLCSHREVDHLLLETVGVDLERGGGLENMRCVQVNSARGRRDKAEDVEVWDYVVAEGDIDESGQEERDIGADEVEYKDLLYHGCVVAGLVLVVLELGEHLGDTREDAGEHGYQRAQDSGREEDEHRFERPVVHLAQEDLDRKYARVQRAEQGARTERERNLERLACESLPRWEKLDNLTSDGVFDFFFMDELGAAVLEGGDIADAPANGEVDFLPLPVLDKYYRPKAVGYCEGERVGREE